MRCGTVVMVIFLAVIVGAIIRPPTTTKTDDPPAKAKPDERLKRGVDAFLKIADMPKEAARDNAIKDWIKEYPDLAENAMKNRKGD